MSEEQEWINRVIAKAAADHPSTSDAVSETVSQLLSGSLSDRSLPQGERDRLAQQLLSKVKPDGSHGETQE